MELVIVMKDSATTTAPLRCALMVALLMVNASTELAFATLVLLVMTAVKKLALRIALGMESAARVTVHARRVTRVLIAR